MSSTLGICLALGAAAGAAELPPPAASTSAIAAAVKVAGTRVFVPAKRFTLAWTHSIELVRWEEDYAVHAHGADSARATPQLRALKSRVRGSAAGMEPGPDAVLRDGWFEYHPTQRVHIHLWLTRSPYTADYELCVDGQACRPLSTWLPSDGWRTRLWPCRG